MIIQDKLKANYTDYPVDMLIHIPLLSCYNSNYYRSPKGDLLYGLSNDDTKTEWFLIFHERKIHIGTSFVYDEPEVIITEIFT